MVAGFNKKELKNGLRLITVAHDSPTVTVLFLVEAGSKYETRDINGISHFLEHMCFKGTTRRPNAIAISSELDAIGAQYNAFTGKEYTGYYAKARQEDLGKIFDVLSDIYLNSAFDSNEIDKERGVIIEEINMYEDMPMHQVQELFDALMYGDQPAGWEIGGRKEVINQVTREQFVSYHGTHYVPNATALIVAGNIKESEIEKMAEEVFGALPAKEKPGMSATKEAQTAPAAMVKFKQTDQAHIVLGVRSFSATDERRYAINLMANVLGGWMSSRLFQRVREAMGAAYYIKASQDAYFDHGYLAAHAGITLAKLPDAINAILDEFRRLKTEPISEEELSRARGNVIGGMAIELETSDSLANFYGSQEIVFRKIRTADEIIARINSVTAEEIMAVANEIFTNDRLNLAIIGPFQDDSAFKDLLHF